MQIDEKRHIINYRASIVSFSSKKNTKAQKKIACLILHVNTIISIVSLCAVLTSELCK